MYLFAVYIHDIIVKLQQSNTVYHIKGTFLGIFVYVDDIILLAPSVGLLQQLFTICGAELAKLNMILNAKKRCACVFGHRFDGKCTHLNTLDGNSLPWVNTCRHLGVEPTGSRQFKCPLQTLREVTLGSSMQSLGKYVGRHASEEVILQSIKTK